MAILMMLILPIHEHGTCFHLFVSSLISFFSVVQFSEYRSFTSLVRFIPRYLIFLVAISEFSHLYHTCSMSFPYWFRNIFQLLTNQSVSQAFLVILPFVPHSQRSSASVSPPQPTRLLSCKKSKPSFSSKKINLSKNVSPCSLNSFIHLLSISCLFSASHCCSSSSKHPVSSQKYLIDGLKSRLITLRIINKTEKEGYRPTHIYDRGRVLWRIKCCQSTWLTFWEEKDKMDIANYSNLQHKFQVE